MTQAAPPIDSRFHSYYEQHHGMRVLGYPLTGLVEAEGYPAQLYSILAYLLATGASAAIERLRLVSLEVGTAEARPARLAS